MARLSELRQLGRVGLIARGAIESSAFVRLQGILAQYQSDGEYDSLRTNLLRLLNDAYSSAENLGGAQADQTGALDSIAPFSKVARKHSDYQKSLQADVRRNVTAFGRSDRGEKARRKLALRMRMSLENAVARGFEEAQHDAFLRLETKGYKVEKIWIADFINNEPCFYCHSLHGQRRGLHEEFDKDPRRKATSTYVNRLAPPAHPFCHCHCIYLIVTLDTVFEEIHPETTPEPERVMTSAEVRSLSDVVFNAVVAALEAVVKRLRKWRRRGRS